jgi:tetratricopeptide (TPR) repeat protein
VTEKLIETRGGSARLYDLQSWLYTEAGNDSAAFQTIIKLDRMRNAGGSDVYGYADRMLRQGNFDMAMEAFDYFIETYGRDNALRPSALYGYVSAVEARDREGGEIGKEAARSLIDRYREVVRGGANRTLALKAQLAIARLQADVLDEPEEALESLRDVRPERGDPLVADFLLLKGELELRLDQIADARRSFSALAATALPYTEVERAREVARLRLAETYLFSGEYKRAVDSLTALTQDVQSVAVNDALDWLTMMNSVTESDSSQLAAYVEASFDWRKRDWDATATAADRAYSSDTSGPLAERALLLKARALRKTGRSNDALNVALRMVEIFDGGVLSDEALFLAAQIADEDRGDRNYALELYTKVLTEYPRSPRAEASRKRIRELRKEES